MTEPPARNWFDPVRASLLRNRNLRHRVDQERNHNTALICR